MNGIGVEEMVGNNSFEELEKLLSNGLNIHEINEHGDNLFLIAVNNAKSIEFLEKIISYGANIHHINKGGKNAILVALSSTNFNDIKINYQYNDELEEFKVIKTTNRLEIIKYLINKGINVKINEIEMRFY